MHSLLLTDDEIRHLRGLLSYGPHRFPADHTVALFDPDVAQRVAAKLYAVNIVVHPAIPMSPDSTPCSA